MLAGKNALEAAAFEEAQSNFRSALSHQRAVDQRERAELLANLATAERGLERWDAALANLDEALEIYLRLGDREMIGRSFTESADALIFAGRIQRGIEMARRGLANLENDVSADRVRLLASLGHGYAAVSDYELADQALREAVDLASRLSDPKLMASVLGARSIVNFNFFRLPQAAEDGFRSEELRGADSPPWQRALQLRVLQQTLIFLGRPLEAARIAGELEPLARKLGQIHSVALCILTGAWAECGSSPDLAKFETVLRQVTEFNQDARYVFWEVLSEVQMSLVNFFRGDWANALLRAQSSARHESGISLDGLGVGAVFRQMAYAGDRAGALALLDEKRTWLPRSGQPNTRGSWWMLGSVVEGLVVLGEQAQAAQLYPLARELIDIGAVVLWPIFRFTETIAGIAAAAARQWKAAEEHFQIAARQAESFPHLIEQTEIHRFQAMMLISRARRGDREKARTLFGEALAGYTRIGMPRHVEMTGTLLDRATSP